MVKEKNLNPGDRTGWQAKRPDLFPGGGGLMLQALSLRQGENWPESAAPDFRREIAGRDNQCCGYKGALAAPAEPPGYIRKHILRYYA